MSDNTAYIILEIVNGVYDGTVYNFESFPVSIGRNPDNDIAIPYESAASRRHAQIFKEEDSFYVVDLTSSNGTFVNDARVSERRDLFNNDLITIGSLIIRCNIGYTKASPSAPPASTSAG